MGQHEQQNPQQDEQQAAESPPPRPRRRGRPRPLPGKRPDIALLAGIVSVAFMLGGLGFVFLYGVPILLDARKTWGWAEVDGQVTASAVRMKSKGVREGESYKPHVTYRYDVDGESFESHQLWLGDNVYLPSRLRAKRIAERYPVGETVTVYHDPADPSRAVLQRGAHTTSYFYVAFGGVIFLIGLIVFLCRGLLARFFAP